MDIYGLVGENISHSFSPDFFNQWFLRKKINAKYRLFDIDDISQLPDIIASDKNIKGLNVTIPYKRKVLSFTDKIDCVASMSGSINTLKIDRRKNNPKILGYNTDVVGFENTITPIIKRHPGIQAYILGTGGSANSVAYVLRKLGVFYYYVSRNPLKITQIRYNTMHKNEMDEHKLIINATPLGMWPNVEMFPLIPYHYITSEHILYDLIYNPKETLFLKKGKEKGATTINGIGMLEEQAKASWKIWTGKAMN